MNDPVATLRAIQDSSTDRVAQDLASLLNRARELGVVVCADVDEDGTVYSVESTNRHADVWWSPSAQQWKAGEHTVQDEIDDANHDPRWGASPSWRCWIARHDECEPAGPEAGCTCTCHAGTAKEEQR